jgi:hypothetical protein
VNKKRILSLVMAIAMGFTFLTFYPDSAEAAQVNLTLSPAQQSATSPNLYTTRAQDLYFEFRTNSSRHAVGFGVYFNNALVSDVKNAPAGSGVSHGYVSPVLVAGNYQLKVSCGGNTQNGCNGSGLLRHD